MSVKLDKAFITAIHGAIYSVWQEVGSDAEACCHEVGEVLTNAAALEVVLDADRLTTFGHKKEDELFHEAIAEHGYPKVAAHLRRHIKLV